MSSELRDSVEVNEALRAVQYRPLLLGDDAVSTSNCYGFACGDSRNWAAWAKPQPGQAVLGGGCEENPDLSRLTTASDQGTRIMAAAAADGLVPAGSDPLRALRNLPASHRLVLFYTEAGNGADYHWVRLDRDLDGALIASHKVGEAPVVSNPVQSLRHLLETTTFGPPDSDLGRYEFRAFFYVPDGLNVGIDAFLERNGFIPPNLRGEDLFFAVEAYEAGRLGQKWAELKGVNGWQPPEGPAPSPQRSRRQE
jgi:hypothetical protein